MKNILESELVDDTATINHIKNLAFSRTATTEGEILAVKYIDSVLKKEKMKTIIEYFDWTGPKRILMRIAYLIIFSYLILYRLFVIIVAYFALKFMSAKMRKMSLIQKEQSKNIYTRIRAKTKAKKRPLIIFSAHYDSFSANVPYRVQSVLFFIFRIIILPYFVVMISLSLLVIADFFSDQISNDLLINLVYSSTLIEFIIIFLIFLLIYDNKKSTGSIDNASGVSILLELAKIINKTPLEHHDIIFLWSGAEEWGMIGSKRFCERHRKKLIKKYDLDHSYAINIDMVGSYIGLLNKTGMRKKSINKDLNKYINFCAKNLDIPIINYSKLIRPNSDYLSFRSFAKKNNKKMQVACFHSEKDSKYIHSAKDKPERCSSRNLNACLDICYNTILLIDSKRSELEEIR